MVAGFLTHPEFCFKVEDLETLQLIERETKQNDTLQFTDKSGTTNQQQISESSTALQSQEVYYFFPALVNTENPPEIWNQVEEERFTSLAGFYIQFSQISFCLLDFSMF